MLTRVVCGLLFRDGFDRADGALGNGWTTESGGQFSIEGGKAKFVIGTLEGQARAPVADRSRMVVQDRRWKSHATGNGVGILAKWRASDQKGYLSWIGDGGVGIYRREYATYHTLLSEYRGYTQAQTWQTVKTLVGDGVQKQWVNGVLRNQTNDTVLNGVLGGAGLRGSGTPGHYNYYDDFIVCADNAVVVTGLPAGYKVRVGALVAVEVGGTASLDLAGTTLPAALLEILDASDTVVASFAGEVWGGDEFALGRTPPAKPVLTAGVVGPFSVQVLGSAFVDPDGDPHLASQWQLDRIGGDFSVPIHDSGAVSGAELLAYTFHGLTRATPYIARVRYQDADGWSEWSDPLAIATVDTWQLCRVRPATDWDPCQRVTPAVRPWAHYRLDELEVTDIPYDASGNERHGAGYHASLVQLGAPGYDGGRAVRLPGTLQLASPAIDIRNVLHDGVGGWAGGGFEDTPPAIHALSSDFGGKGFSVEFWFYAEEETALPTGYGDDYGSRVIWFAQHGGPVESTRNVYAGLGFIAGTNGFVCYGHAGVYIYNGTMLQADLGTGWHHALVITAPAPPKKLCSRLFIDGFYGAEHPARTSYEEVDWTTTYAWTTGRKHIIFLHGFAGSNNPALRGRSFRGRIDDIRIYDHAIDPAAPRDVWVPCGPRPATAWTRGC